MPINVYPEIQQRDLRKSESWNDRRTLQKESEVLIAITNKKPGELATRPPNDSPRENQNSVYGSGRVYGDSIEWGSVVGNPAIVARSNPTCSVSKRKISIHNVESGQLCMNHSIAHTLVDRIPCWHDVDMGDPIPHLCGPRWRELSTHERHIREPGKPRAVANLRVVWDLRGVLYHWVRSGSMG